MELNDREKAVLDSAGALKLLSALVMKPALDDLAATFARATDNKLLIDYGSAREIGDRILNGESHDIAIIQEPGLRALLKQGKIAAGSIVTLARSGLAMAVREGEPRPAIGSVELLRSALLAAESIVYPDPAMGHAGGIQFRAVIEQLGIARAIESKSKLSPGTFAAFVANDHAEIAIMQPMEILAAPGYDIVAWLPSELQDDDGFTWAVGASATSRNLDAAKVLIGFLSSPSAASVIEARGMKPETR